MIEILMIPADAGIAFEGAPEMEKAGLPSSFSLSSCKKVDREEIIRLKPAATFDTKVKSLLHSNESDYSKSLLPQQASCHYHRRQSSSQNLIISRAKSYKMINNGKEKRSVVLQKIIKASRRQQQPRNYATKVQQQLAPNSWKLASSRYLSTASATSNIISWAVLIVSLIGLLVCDESRAFALSPARLHLGGSDLDNRINLESELGSLLFQSSPQLIEQTDWTNSQQQHGLYGQPDGRDKALASAIISRIMLDNLTNACFGQEGCNWQPVAPQINNQHQRQHQQLRQQVYGNDELEQQKTALDEMRLKFLLEQLPLINGQSGAGSQGDVGELVLSAPILPLDQMSNIKRASARLPELNLRSIIEPDNSGSGAFHAREHSLGGVKRPDTSNPILRLDGGSSNSFIKRPASSNRQYEFGLGKRVATPGYSRYDFGLGKRASGKQMNEYRYDFGLGR